jgi:hypothetical protein
VKALAEDVVEEDENNTDEVISKPVKKKTAAKPKAKTADKAKPVKKKTTTVSKAPKE